MNRQPKCSRCRIVLYAVDLIVDNPAAMLGLLLTKAQTDAGQDEVTERLSAMLWMRNETEARA